MKKQDKKLSGTIEKHMSYVMGVPRNIESILDQEKWMKRLQETTLFQYEHCERDEEGNLILQLKYEKEQYKVQLFIEEVEFPELYTINHQLSKEDYEALQKVQQGLTTAMLFGEDVMTSYLVQLKVIAALIPELLGVIDFSAERIYSGRWATLAAQSKVPPAPHYIYSIQAISNEGDDTVWLHTHGLNRCGKIEVEVLNSNKAYYADHAHILQGMASNLMNSQDEVLEGEAELIAYCQGKLPIMATWLPWYKAVEFYDEDMLGGAKSHEEHGGPSGAIFLYLSPEDCKKGKVTQLIAMEDLFKDNVMVMFDNKETERMRNLARERFEYFKKYIQNEENYGIIKFGLKVDEEYEDETGDGREHIWFEILEISGNKMKACLTQEPYMIKGIKTGDILELDLEDMTDWMIYTTEFSVTPDNIYLMEME